MNQRETYKQSVKQQIEQEDKAILNQIDKFTQQNEIMSESMVTLSEEVKGTLGKLWDMTIEVQQEVKKVESATNDLYDKGTKLIRLMETTGEKVIHNIRRESKILKIKTLTYMTISSVLTGVLTVYLILLKVGIKLF